MSSNSWNYVSVPQKNVDKFYLYVAMYTVWVVMRGRKEELMQMVSNILPFVVDLYGLEDYVVVYGLLIEYLSQSN